MKAVNAHYRKHKTLDGCPVLSEHVAAKIKASMSRSWRKDPVPFETWALTNNNANIHRVRDRLNELERIRESQADAVPPIEGDGFRVVQNAEACRVQFLFDDKPDEATRALLKSNGFRWAPSEKAWQRLLNQNGLRAARIVANELNGG